MRPTLTPNIFVTENGRKSDFPPARNPTTSSFDQLSYGDFGFISWGNEEKQNKTQILNSTTRTSDPCRVGRSTFIASSSKKGNGMRNLLGSCVRAFLFAGPARSSRSHGARVACGRRSQKKKTLDCCFGCLEFVWWQSCCCTATTHAISAKVILMLSLSVVVDARVLCPNCVLE